MTTKETALAARRIRRHAHSVQDAADLDSPIRNLASMIIDLAFLIDDGLDLEASEVAGTTGANPEPADRGHGTNVFIGQVIEHSRLLDACAPDVVIRNGDGKAAATYFRRTRQKRGGVGRKWQPCTENGEIKPLPAWPDGFDSDQVFLPATVVKLPTQVIR